MTAKNDLSYLTSVLDRGGPSSPAEMQQVIVKVRSLSKRIDELEAKADSSDQEAAIAELRSMHTQLQSAYDNLEAELEKKKIENRTLKGKVTRLEKKVDNDDTSS